MKQADIDILAREDAFKLIGKEWMLVTGGTLDKGFNTMTASWGGIGWLWNKPVAFVFIRPERFTHGFVEATDHLTLSFLGNDPAMRKVLNLCGTLSGRDHDKAAESGIALTDADDRNEIRIRIPHDMTFPGRIGRHEVFWIDTDPETGEQTRTLLAWGHLTILEAGYGRPGD